MACRRQLTKVPLACHRVHNTRDGLCLREIEVQTLHHRAVWHRQNSHVLRGPFACELEYGLPWSASDTSRRMGACHPQSCRIEVLLESLPRVPKVYVMYHNLRRPGLVAELSRQH